MRNLYSFLLAVLFFCLLLCPMLAGAKKGEDFLDSGEDFGAEDVFKIKFGEEIISLSAEDYICGVVAAEMPALYEAEALKAQAIAAYTYAARERLAAKGREYHLEADSAIHQAYIDKAGMQEKWGENAAEYEAKIRECVRAVAGKRLTYKGELIFAAYHAISCGTTETAKTIWGKDYDYLKSMASEWDKTHEKYESSLAVSLEEFCQKLEIEQPENPKEVKITLDKSEAGTVTKLTVFGHSFKGTKLREAFSLRSSVFNLEYKEGNFVFTVWGYGHGVGMSQWGANCLAKEGKTHEEILKYYYQGVEITKKE